MSTPEDMAYEGRREMWLDSLPVLGKCPDPECGGEVKDLGEGSECMSCDTRLTPEQVIPLPDTPVKVLFVCTVCGTGFAGKAEHRHVGQRLNRVCYFKDCLRTQPHYVAASPNWNRNEVTLPLEIPAPPKLAE